MPFRALACLAVCAVSAQAQSLVDVASEVGLTFVHDNGAKGSYFMPEIMGAGGALGDFDGDGDLDVLALDGAGLASKGAIHRLFRNDLRRHEDGTTTLHFVDISETALPQPNSHGMGAAVADYDGDGDLDVYVTSAGDNALWRNLGDGRFEDVTDRAKVRDSRWSTTATFFDSDGDGWLDLFVGNYLDFTVGKHQVCVNRASIVDYCGPTTYPPLTNRLWRNLGDGTFADVSDASGIAAVPASTLGVVAADLNGDALVDLYVANDLMPNQLLIGDGRGSFSDEALIAGVAMSGEGRAEAGMGVVAEDLDGRGGLDLFVTHLDGQTNTLYLADGSGFFSDRTDAAGLGPPSLAKTGFGIAVLDFDNDGLDDLFVANGAVKIQAEQLSAGDERPFHQPNQLFRGLGGGRFSDASKQLPRSSRNSRGVARGDVDLDGFTDLVVFNNGGPAELLLSTRSLSEPDAKGRLAVCVEPHSSVPGATLSVETNSQNLQQDAPVLKRAHGDGSYATASSPCRSFKIPNNLDPGADRRSRPRHSTRSAPRAASGPWSRCPETGANNTVNLRDRARLRRALVTVGLTASLGVFAAASVSSQRTSSSSVPRPSLPPP